MVNEELRFQLLGMQAGRPLRSPGTDGRGRTGRRVRPAEAVHIRNAARLRALIAGHGWPAEDIAGNDGAEAAWLIAQHAVGELEFQRQALKMLLESAVAGRTPAWHAACQGHFTQNSLSLCKIGVQSLPFSKSQTASEVRP